MWKPKPFACKEFKKCAGMDQQDQQDQQGPPEGKEEKLPDEVNKKLEECNAEEQIEKWRACLPKNCGEFLDCVGYKEDGGGQSAGGAKGPSMPADVDAKFKQCLNERNVAKQLACFDGRSCEQALACLGGGGGGKKGREAEMLTQGLSPRLKHVHRKSRREVVERWEAAESACRMTRDVYASAKIIATDVILRAGRRVSAPMLVNKAVKRNLTSV